MNPAVAHPLDAKLKRMNFKILAVAATLGLAASQPQVHLDPVLATGPQGRWDSGLIDPGGVAFDGQQFHMLFNAIPEWPHPLAVGYAVSSDGIEWRRARQEPVLRTEDLPGEAWSIRANSLIKTESGWLLYLSASNQERRLDGSIWAAKAAQPAGPWKFHPQPVLTASEGAWDGGGVGDAVVVRQKGQLSMYFTGFDAERRGRVGRAISSDGLNWVKQDDPVLDLADESQWDGRSLGARGMLGDDSSGWTLLYHSWRPGNAALGLATSQDGVEWKRFESNPVFSANQAEAWQSIYYSTAIRLPGRLGILLEAQAAGSEKTAVYLIEVPGR